MDRERGASEESSGREAENKEGCLPKHIIAEDKRVGQDRLRPNHKGLEALKGLNFCEGRGDC